ncbi:hypothetical protein [Catenulispora subtropica]|uniref:Membrane protein n=1 Tax=Catenulispora subtropica TaxID=450798 RepID=A0ABP5DGP5_9ACTN
MAGSVGSENPIQRLVRGFREHPLTEAAGRCTATTWHVGKRAKARVLDVGHPLVVLVRGTKRMAGDAKTYWTEAGGHEKHKEWRDLVVFVFAVCAVAVGFQPYGVLLLIAIWAAAATYLGRDRPDPGKDPETDAHIARLQSAYNGLVPYLMDTHDPDERFKPGGGYRSGFTEWEFDEADRLVALKIEYSPFFKDGEADARAKVERALEGKIGQANEYLYDWDEEGNKLAVRILPPLPTGIPAQPWKVAEIEYVLGFTDPTSTARLIPVQLGAEAGGDLPVVELAPVVWRHGRFAAEPHLLVAGVLGSGKSNLLRSLAAQALGHGHLVTAVDAEHTGHFDEFTGRDGVVRIESGAAGALDLLDWVAAESGRRAERLRDLGETDDTLIAELAKPLWVFVDELPSLGEAAARAGLADPQDLLADLMRAGRTTGITVVLSCRAERVGELRATVRNQAHARVGLGQLPPAASTALFGGTLEIGGPSVLPPGRGFARVGGGPVVRLQVPVAADVVGALPVLVGAIVEDGESGGDGEIERLDGE